MEKKKLPTMMDVAAQAGVGKSTVSLALRDDPRLRPETRLHIQKIAQEMGYTPNATVANLMAQLRASRTPSYQATLGLLNFSHHRDYLHSVPTFREWLAGCHERAAQLGYRIDEFWVQDKDVSAHRLVKVLSSRGIRGLLFTAIDQVGDLGQELAELWESFASVILGIRTHQPALHFCCNDHYSTSMLAANEVIARGYRRPALVIDHAVDRLVEHRFSAGFLIGQSSLPVKNRIPVLYLKDREPHDFNKWMSHHTPDVILTLHDEVLEWMEAVGYRVPDDVALAHLDWYPPMKRWAGMDQSNRAVGSAALDMVVAQLHRGETGIPPMAKCLQIESRWVEGPSIRSVRD